MPCPACGSQRVRPVKPRNRWESFHRNWTQTRFYACKECGWRARRPRPSDSLRERVDVRFWAFAALVAVGILYVLLRK